MRLPLLSFAAALAFVVPAETLAAAEQPETSGLAFVKEYVSELAALEGIRDSGEREFKKGPVAGSFFSMIHTSTLFQLELRTRIRMLGRMHLNPPLDSVIPSITRIYELKIALHQKIIDIASAFIGGPKDGVDYGKLAAQMPQVRAMLDRADDSLFKVTPLVFEALVDPREDSKNHVSHLVITKAEKAELIGTLRSSFGAKLDERGQNYWISSAALLKTYLLKDFKCADEPWE